MKKILIRGMLISLPIVITVYVLWSVFVKLDTLLQPILFKLLGVNIIGLGFVVIVVGMFIVGLIGDTFIGKTFFKMWDRIKNRFSIVDKIYKPVKQVVDSFKEENDSTFDTVVEFNIDNVTFIGFLTNKDTNAVFVPSSPTPISGFVIYPKKYKVIDMSVEEALRRVLSLGSL